MKLSLENIHIKESVESWGKSIRDYTISISADTMGWVAAILLHLSTIPTLLAVLTGLTDRMPPVDMVLFSWTGLFCFFLRAAIQKDFLNILTIGFGFFCQAVMLALIVFK